MKRLGGLFLLLIFQWAWIFPYAISFHVLILSNMRITWETSSSMSGCRKNSTKGIRPFARLWHLPDFLIFNWNWSIKINRKILKILILFFWKPQVKFLIFLSNKRFFRPLKVGSNPKEHSVVTSYCVPLYNNIHKFSSLKRSAEVTADLKEKIASYSICVIWEEHDYSVRPRSLSS